MKAKKGISTKSIIIGFIVLFGLLIVLLVLYSKFTGRTISLLDFIENLFRFGGAGE